MRFQVEVRSGFTDGKPCWTKRAGYLLRSFHDRADADDEIVRLKALYPEVVYRIRKVTKR